MSSAITASICARFEEDSDTDSGLTIGTCANAVCANSKRANEIRRVDRRMFIESFSRKDATEQSVPGSKNAFCVSLDALRLCVKLLHSPQLCPGSTRVKSRQRDRQLTYDIDLA